MVWGFPPNPNRHFRTNPAYHLFQPWSENAGRLGRAEASNVFARAKPTSQEAGYAFHGGGPACRGRGRPGFQWAPSASCLYKHAVQNPALASKEW